MIHIYIYTQTYIYIYIYIHTCIYIYIYIYIYMNRSWTDNLNITHMRSRSVHKPPFTNSVSLLLNTVVVTPRVLSLLRDPGALLSSMHTFRHFEQTMATYMGFAALLWKPVCPYPVWKPVTKEPPQGRSLIIIVIVLVIIRIVMMIITFNN